MLAPIGLHEESTARLLPLLATPRTFTSACLSPIDNAITTSPSYMVQTGEIERATPMLPNCASLLVMGFESRALVATTTSVVFLFCKSVRPAPRFICSAVFAKSRDSRETRAPATILPVDGSMTSPTAFTAASAETTTPPESGIVYDPIPDFMARVMPNNLPTVAPVPAPTAPSTTALLVAAADADSPISRVGCALLLPMPRS